MKVIVELWRGKKTPEKSRLGDTNGKTRVVCTDWSMQWSCDRVMFNNAYRR